MPLQGGLLLAALPNLYLNESPVNYVTDGNALSTYLISQESQRMDQTLMAIQTKFTIATFIGDEKMFREAVDETAHFYLHAVGDGLNLHADRIATSVNQAYQRLSLIHI